MSETMDRKTRSIKRSIPKDTLNNLIKSAEECAKRGSERMNLIRNEKEKHNDNCN